jgi:hypothetical protein
MYDCFVINSLALELNAWCILKKLGIETVSITLRAVGNIHALCQAFQPNTEHRALLNFSSKGLILLSVASILPFTALYRIC